MSDQVRVLRILEYVGDRCAVESTLQKGYIPSNGMKELSTNGGKMIVKSTIMELFPEILENVESL